MQVYLIVFYVIVVIYITTTMSLGTVSVCMTVLVLNLHFRRSETPVPQFIRVIITNYLAKILCVGKRSFGDTTWITTHDNVITVNGTLPTSTKDSGAMKPMLRQTQSETRPSPTTPKDELNGTLSNHERSIIYEHPTSQWKEVAHVLDRFFFCLVFFGMTTSTLIIFLVPHYKESRFS